MVGSVFVALGGVERGGGSWLLLLFPAALAVLLLWCSGTVCKKSHTNNTATFHPDSRACTHFGLLLILGGEQRADDNDGGGSTLALPTREFCVFFGFHHRSIAAQNNHIYTSANTHYAHLTRARAKHTNRVRALTNDAN